MGNRLLAAAGGGSAPSLADPYFTLNTYEPCFSVTAGSKAAVRSRGRWRADEGRLCPHPVHSARLCAVLGPVRGNQAAAAGGNHVTQLQRGAWKYLQAAETMIEGVIMSRLLVATT